MKITDYNLMDSIFEFLVKAFLKFLDLRNLEFRNDFFYLFILFLLFFEEMNPISFSEFWCIPISISSSFVQQHYSSEKNEITIKVCSVPFSVQIFFSFFFFCKSSILREGPMRFYDQTLMPSILLYIYVCSNRCLCVCLKWTYHHD